MKDIQHELEGLRIESDVFWRTALRMLVEMGVATDEQISGKLSHPDPDKRLPWERLMYFVAKWSDLRLKRHRLWLENGKPETYESALIKNAIARAEKKTFGDDHD